MANTQHRDPTPGQTIQALKVGGFTTLRKIDQGGALQARRLASGGVQFYWRYTHEGRTDRIIIGAYDSSAPPKSLTATQKGYSFAAAVEVCRVKAQIQVTNVESGGYRQHATDKRKAREIADQTRIDEQQQTFSKLLDTYVEYLRQCERRSYSDARSLFRLHVVNAFPEIAGSPAASIQHTQVTDILRKLTTAGKGRTSNKLRAYIRAAYQCAADVDSLADIPDSFKAFGISVNPAAMTKRVAKADKADKNPLSIDELRIYWRLIEKLPGVKGAALRLHLLTGGQRVEQLVSLKNVEVKSASLAIYDGKGRPGQSARRHVVPILPISRPDLLILKNEGVYAISNDGGKRRVSGMTMSNWAQAIAKDEIHEFQLKRVRSGVETALASARVSKEIRGHLQSHGLSGVQAKHYDDHDYFDEKLEALQILWQLIGSKGKKRAGKP